MTRQQFGAREPSSEIEQGSSATQANLPHSAKELLSRFYQWCEALSKAGGGIGGAACAATMLVVVYDVVMRYAFNRPTTWAAEIAMAMFFVLVFLGLGYAELLHAHVKMDLVLRSLSQRWQKRMGRVAVVISLLYCGFLTWATALFASTAFRLDIRSQWLEIRLSWVYLLMPIGVAILFLQILFGALRGKNSIK